jgi:hypothetical protein
MILGSWSPTSEAGAQLDRTYAEVRFGGDFEPITAIPMPSRPGIHASFASAIKTFRYCLT